MKKTLNPQLDLQPNSPSSSRSRFGESLLHHRIYWRDRLSGELPETGILTDYLRPGQWSRKNRRARFELSDRLSQSILRISRSSHLSVYLLLLAGFAILLGKYTRSNDLILGIPTYHPLEPDEPLENPGTSSTNEVVPLRFEVNDRLTFKELLSYVKESTIRAYAHQSYPLELLLDELELPQPSERHPLYDIVVLLDGIHRRPVDDKQDLAVSWQVDGEKIAGSIEYSDRLFASETIEALVGYLINGIEGAIAHPDIPISQIHVLKEEDTDRLLKEFNDNAKAYPVRQTIQSLFEARVERSPNRIAAVCRDKSFTYRELNAEANRLARLLGELGVKKGDFVGILQGRDLNFLKSILAILKAGAAYTPIDSSYPPERIQYMLANSEVKVLLTEPSMAELVSDRSSHYPHLQWAICLDGEGKFEACLTPSDSPLKNKPLPNEELSEENLELPGSGRDRAYMLYTSGSTGLPKGAIVRHDGAINHIYAQFDALKLDENLRFLQSAPASSDISVWQFLAPLLIGGRTVIVDTETICDPPQLFQLVRDRKITLVEFVPVVLKGLIDYASQLSVQARSLPHLQWMMATGEYVPVDLVDRWLNLYPAIPAVNAYGPTEAADDITQLIIEKPLPENQRSIPIGKPLANLNLYVLDERMQLVPIGVPGEICVSGIGVGDGYWQNPEKTELSFVPNPFADSEQLFEADSHNALYKTGDLGRWLPDGTIEYLGRLDRQVKIRGFRIELGEIEVALNQHVAIREAAAIVREDKPGEKCLVAYTVAQAETEIDARDLRSFLSDKLPDYMMPSAFVPIERLPLTPSGKIDRKALAAPDEDALLTSGSDAAATPVEEILVGIWSSVLKRDRVGVRDNFFELGGHSLLATTVISKLRQVFQLELPLRRLFELPTIRQLAAAIESARQDESDVLPIEPRDRSEPLALSFAQQRMWFLAQLEPDSPFYNIPAAVRFQGDLDRDALEKTFNVILRRHETLRTRIEDVAGRPVATVSEDSLLPIARADLSSLPPEERDAEMQRLIAAEARQPFDLASDLAIRVKLLHLAPNDSVLLVTLHHIAADGWSIGVLVSEIAVLYPAFAANQPSSLPVLPVQYGDFAAWQQQRLQGEVLERQLSYWRDRLEGAPALLELPTDRPRPAVQSFQGANYRFAIAPEISAALSRVSQQAGCTLFMTLFAGFDILLARYSNSTDIVVGVPIANRNRAEIENVIGLFVNTLVLRTDLSDDPAIDDLLARVREIALGAYAHQDMPFERLVEELQPERSLGHSPLFQVLFILQNAPFSEIELPGLTLSLLENDRGVAQFDLTLSMEEKESGLVGEFEYNIELFDETTIARMAECYQMLLAAIAADPTQRVSELPSLTETERQQLSAWNQTDTEYLQTFCIHQLFEAQVERTPEAIALVLEDRQLTYAELNRKANQLARHLQTLGAQPDGLVGICCDRSPEMVIGMLGILKAGAAYVPLDPYYPEERLQWMVSDSEMPILLTQEKWQGVLPDRQARIVCWEKDGGAIAGQSDRNLESPVASDRLAYVIYTSGSTGKPKGVQIEHRNAVNFLTSMQQQPGLEASDTLLAVTSISFDIAALELFLPLVTGARVALASREVAMDGALLDRAIATTEATVMQATPATWRMLRASGWKGQAGLKILCGGEALSGDLAEWLAASGTTVWNLYGPTETTIWSAVYPLEQTEFPATIPVGHPIANTRLYVLDRHGESVPIGVAGELHIGGAGLARGYLKRAELTVEKFIAHPRWGRLYRTGDVARYRADGAIEYLGRTDYQVKIRGFRIELGEIEAALSQFPSVREAVAIARPNDRDEKTLVAYVVAAQESLSTSALRDFLQNKLPDYMVPSSFVTLDALPLTPNGKVDRKALPEPERAIALSDDDLPATPTEVSIANIWTRVLGCDRVGVRQNFFELGGHSLLATQVVSQMREAFQVELPLRRLFECSTIERLARAVETATQERWMLAAPAIAPRPDPNVIPLSFAQQRLWFLAQLEPDSPFYNIPIAVRLRGTLDTSALEQTFAEILRRHEVLRTAIANHQGEPVATLVPARSMPLSPIDLSALPEAERDAEVRRAIAAEARQPFDLARDLLLRAKLLQLAPDENVLLVTLHHIAADGWSIGVLVEEVAALYPAFADNKPSSLLAPPVQYADFAAWQHQWLQGEVLERQLSYWRDCLEGAPALMELPTDRPRPAVQSFQGAIYTFAIAPEVATALHRISQQAGCTLFTILLAGFDILLGRYSNSDDIVVGTPIANRNRTETERLIGLFVNMLVLRTDLSGDPKVEDLLARVWEIALGAYAHQDMPFEQLVEALQPERSLDRGPLFQVMFALQNAPFSEIELPGLTLSALESDRGAAQFDLSLAMEETAAGLQGEFEYNIDLFDEATIARMAEHFQIVLAAIAADPTQRISELPLLAEAEKQQFVRWNQTEAEYPRTFCIHQLFEAQVERTPDAIALVFEGRQLTYAELDRKANQLARYLQTLGAQPDGLVGICCDRSPEMVIGLLGILKAGAAYVPLDPYYPEERLQWMVSDSEMPLLLTQEKWRSHLPNHQARVVSWEKDGDAIAGQSASHPESPVTSDRLAYVIYTSGSTGKPKGVQIEHCNAVNFLTSMQQRLGLEAADTLLAVTSISFDIAFLELFLPLITGARVALASREVAMDGALLSRQLETTGATAMQATPATWQMLLTSGWTGQAGLKILCGGEALGGDLAKQLAASATTVWNLYGPTETTIWSAVYPLEQTEFPATIPIGRPIANTRLYVLDRHGRQVPVGVAGELHIGGAGLARGYLKRAGLTEEKFIVHPQWGRLYRTGDVARYRADGAIAYLGRADFQVKVRGFRIELGEVEAALNQHPSVREAVAIARPDPAGEARLVAYAVFHPDLQTETGSLRAFLQEKLPEYMVPSSFVTLDALPLTPNGKVDRKALPEPDTSRNEAEIVLPRNATETTLANIYAEVLGLETVGVWDNFFELGGHSLLATRALSRLNEVFEMELPLRSLFEKPTVADLAERIEVLRLTIDRASQPISTTANGRKEIEL